MSIAVTNTSANLSGKTVVTAEGDRTITGLLSYSRSSSAPFAVNAGAAMVTNLDSNFLAGHDVTFYTNANNLSAGTVPVARNSAVPASITTTQTGNVTAIVLPAGDGDLFLRCNNASLLTIQGIAAGRDGQLLTVASIGAGLVTFAHENASATAANRLHQFVTVASLAAGVGYAMFIYDATTARWRMIQHEQGEWITETFAAGNYTNNGGTAWTVSSGNEQTRAYYVQGRRLHLMINIAATTVGAGATALRMILPATLNATGTNVATGVMRYRDNGTYGIGYIQMNPGGASGSSIVEFWHTDPTASWSASTGATDVSAAITIDAV